MEALTIEVRVVQVGGSFIAATTMAGVQVRGRRCDDALDAVQSLLSALGSPSNDDAVLALELALSGQSIASAFGTPAIGG